MNSAEPGEFPFSQAKLRDTCPTAHASPILFPELPRYDEVLGRTREVGEVTGSDRMSAPA